MKSSYLFDFKYKKWGWILLIPAMILGILSTAGGNFWEIPVLSIFHDSFMGSENDGLFRIVRNDISDEIAAVGTIIGAILIALSKEKIEDEFIAKTRLDSLVWALYLYYGLLTLAFIFIYDGSFLNVLIFDSFAFLIFFLIKFRYTLYKNKRSVRYEE